jgi:hypothetical protein
MPIERFVSRKTFALFNEDTGSGGDEGGGKPGTGDCGFRSIRYYSYDARMFKQGEYAPGTPVPVIGRY